jgi:hypothetical protein
MKARKTLRGKPVNVRLDPDVEEEIEKIAAETRLPKVEILRQCARAGAEAIAQNGYELPAPLRMRIVKSEGLDQTVPAQTKRRLAS